MFLTNSCLESSSIPIYPEFRVVSSLKIAFLVSKSIFSVKSGIFKQKKLKIRVFRLKIDFFRVFRGKIAHFWAENRFFPSFRCSIAHFAQIFRQKSHKPSARSCLLAKTKIIASFISRSLIIRWSSIRASSTLKIPNFSVEKIDFVQEKNQFFRIFRLKTCLYQRRPSQKWAPEFLCNNVARGVEFCPVRRRPEEKLGFLGVFRPKSGVFRPKSRVFGAENSPKRWIWYFYTWQSPHWSPPSELWSLIARASVCTELLEKKSIFSIFLAVKIEISAKNSLVLPAASSPSINIRSSFLPKIFDRNLPIFRSKNVIFRQKIPKLVRFLSKKLEKSTKMSHFSRKFALKRRKKEEKINFRVAPPSFASGARAICKWCARDLLFSCFIFRGINRIYYWFIQFFQIFSEKIMKNC